MAFDWITFFQRNGIDYVERGPNVSRGHVAIHCPFCGPADQSQHLSINLEGKGWRCFRSFEHRGRSPVRLIAALTGVSYDTAAAMIGHQTYIPEDFMGRINQLLRPGPLEEATPGKGLTLLPEFKRFGGLPSARPFLRYLERRGYPENKVYALADQFNIRYCVRGPFHHRIIFPIQFEGKLVNWTGRSLVPDAQLRYMTLSMDAERAKEQKLPVALGKITDYLLWYDALLEVDADTIYLVEGPFDALRVWYLGQRQGIVATCFFTSQGSENQVSLLHELLPRFKYRYLLLDANTLSIAMRFHDRLAGLGVTVRKLPPGIKDPGLLTDAKFLRHPS